MEIYVRISLISIFSFFQDFYHDFIRCFDFTHIAALNTASDDVTNWVTHRIFNTDLSYSGAHFSRYLWKCRFNGAF